MAERIKRLFSQGRINADCVKNALQKGLITEEECEDILMSGSALQWSKDGAKK